VCEGRTAIKTVYAIFQKDANANTAKTPTCSASAQRRLGSRLSAFALAVGAALCDNYFHVGCRRDFALPFAYFR